MYLIISWFYSLGKISGIVPEPKLKNWKTEFSREIQEEILHMDSVFMFFCFAYGTIPEYFRRHFGIFAEKQKNRKTEKLNFPEGSRKRFSIWIQFSFFLFFSFSVLLTELFRNISGDISEYLRRNWKTEDQKNWKTEKWKTEKLKNWIFQRDPGRDSPYGFSFSVFLFFSFVAE